MKSTMTPAIIAAQPGWYLAVFTNKEGIDAVRCEQIIAWEIQRMTSPNGLVTRVPVPITAESKNADLDCAMWGIKRPDGKFVFPVGATLGLSEEKLSKFALLMETESLVEPLAFPLQPNGNADHGLNPAATNGAPDVSERIRAPLPTTAG